MVPAVAKERPCRMLIQCNTINLYWKKELAVSTEGNIISCSHRPYSMEVTYYDYDYHSGNTQPHQKRFILCLVEQNFTLNSFRLLLAIDFVVRGGSTGGGGGRES